MNEKELKEFGEKIRKRNVRHTLINYSLGLIISTLLFTGYIYFTGDLNFVGRKKEETCAAIIKQQRYHWGRGNYKYKVTYEFVVNKKKYSDTYRAWKENELGDCVMIEYVANSPGISRIK